LDAQSAVGPDAGEVHEWVERQVLGITRGVFGSCE